jgi:hypothetical protein
MAKEYQRIIAMQERANGNETIGTAWIDAKSFDKSTPVEEIIKWAGNQEGRLMITPDYDSANSTF